MGNISLDAELQFSVGAAHEAVRSALASLCERSHRGDVALSAVVHPASRSELATVAVPVLLESDAATAHRGSNLSLTIRARSAAGAFPTFTGTVSVEDEGSARSRVHLQGEYKVPLGPIGADADALVLHAVAQDSLRRLFEDLISEAETAVHKEQEEAYRDFRRGHN